MVIRIGKPEDAPKKEARPHRCNDRVEDVIQAQHEVQSFVLQKALFDGFGDYKNTLMPAWSIMWKCFRSAEGDEPPDPYIFLTPDNPAYRDIGAARRSKSDKGEDAWNDDFKPNDDVKPSERME